MLSNIKSISIKDFRCLKEVFLDFTESPIICLQAGNDSGKSSIVKAIESTIYNSNNSVSKGFIRTGSTGFKIKLELMDGNVIERERGTVGNVYRLIAPDGTVVCEHSKLDKGDVPPEIAHLLNVFCDETTGELLNIRTCESLLLFALTTGSENYKIMHTGLKVDQVSNAINLGKKRTNELKGAMDNSNYLISEYNKQIRGINIPDLTPVEQLKERIATNSKKAAALKEAIALSYDINGLKQSVSADSQKLINLKEIDTTYVELIDDMTKAIELLTELSANKSNLEGLQNKLPEEIDSKKIEIINNVSEAILILKELNDSKSKLSGITAELPEEISVELFELLESAGATLSALNALRAQRDETVKTVDEVEKALSESLAQINLLYVAEENAIRYKCKNCGEEEMIDLASIEQACSNSINA